MLYEPIDFESKYKRKSKYVFHHFIMSPICCDPDRDLNYFLCCALQTTESGSSIYKAEAVDRDTGSGGSVTYYLQVLLRRILPTHIPPTLTSAINDAINTIYKPKTISRDKTFLSKMSLCETLADTVQYWRFLYGLTRLASVRFYNISVYSACTCA